MERWITNDVNYIFASNLVEFLNDFISNRNTRFFIRNARLNLAKNQAKAKQHTEAELLLNENYLPSSSTLSSRSNSRYSKKCTKSNHICLNEVN